MNLTKKNLTVVLLGMIIILPLLTTSCFKKGDEDPFLSMYTRKARVTGNWTIASFYEDVKRDDGIDQTRTITDIAELDWSRTITIIGTDSIREIEGTVIDGRNTITFDSDGRYNEVWEYEYSEETTIGDDEGTLTTITKVQESTSGTWNFLHNIDDYKRKERMALVVEESKSKTFIYELVIMEDDETTPIPVLVNTFASSRAYANGAYSTIWALRMLKNKQIIMDQNIDDFYVYTIDGIGTSLTEVGYRTKTLTRE